jgi:hypothetical protein
MMLVAVYLKTQGINATTHGVKKELVCTNVTPDDTLHQRSNHTDDCDMITQDRVKKYIAKVAEASKKPEANPMRVDK